MEVKIHKIENGAKFSAGSDFSSITFYVEHHFNWFQKLMIKWCFGFTVEDYNEE